MSRARRTKYIVLAAVVVASALVLLAATQTWYSLTLTRVAEHPSPIVVPGSIAAPALTALSLAGLAMAGALAIAGRVARYALAVLGLVIAACVLGSVAGAMANPVSTGSALVSKATGVAGEASVDHLIAHTEATGWPYVALAGGVLAALAAVAVLVTGSAWPTGSKRYSAVRFAAADEPVSTGGETGASGNARDRAIDSWDELSRGDDPTDVR